MRFDTLRSTEREYLRYVKALVVPVVLGSPALAFGHQAVNLSAPHEVSPYLTTRVLTLESGQSIDEMVINGPSTPPDGYAFERASVALPVGGESKNSLIVPAFSWVFGCSSVSGSMIAGYYDRNDYPDIYTGPTNGGVTPLDNSVWGIWADGYATYRNIPLAASHAGVDGRTSRGSIDDYWVEYGSGSSDPYITNGWAQHAWGDAIGDYMKTSQSAYGNTDGATTFYTWTSSASPLACSDMETYDIHSLDGTYGRKLFYEARGYTVTDCYNQKTDNTISGGFAYEDFKSEIDAGRPVMLNLEGHTIVGVGYDDASNLIYIHDTWDHEDHSMTWGGSYSGMKLLSVSIVNLAPPSDDYTLTLTKFGTGSGVVTGSGIDCGSDCSESYAEGTSVMLTASADAGSVFSGWAGACKGTGVCTLAMDADKRVAAAFKPVRGYKLTVKIRGKGQGAVTSEPAGIDCGSDCTESFRGGTQVTLTATPAGSDTFAGWGGACKGKDDCVVDMTSAKRVTATFR